MSSIKNISLYIPHIFANISKTDVANVFDEQDIGKVSNIDFILKTTQDGKPYNAAYIHFECWYNNKSAINFQERILNPEKEARLMYEDPWYWIVLENKGRKVAFGDRKPRIDLGDSSNVISAFKITPKKTNTTVVLPNAPIKNISYAQALTPTFEGVKSLEEEFNVRAQLNALAEQIDDEYAMDEIDAEIDANDAIMDEIEAMIEEEDSNLVWVDSRYIQTIESENAELRNQLAYYQCLVVTEQVKSQTFAEALKLLK